MISKEVYMDVRAMKRSGKSIRAIAKELGLHRQTVKKHLERADLRISISFFRGMLNSRPWR